MIPYVLILVVVTVFFLRNRFLAESQQKEIAYLKEINHGMEMLVQKNNEIRHTTDPASGNDGEPHCT